MLNTPTSPTNLGFVTALFEDGPHTFTLARGATLAALSRRLASLRRQHHGKLLDISVRFDLRPETTYNEPARKARSDVARASAARPG